VLLVMGKNRYERKKGEIERGARKIFGERNEKTKYILVLSIKKVNSCTLINKLLSEREKKKLIL